MPCSVGRRWATKRCLIWVRGQKKRGGPCILCSLTNIISGSTAPNGPAGALKFRSGPEKSGRTPLANQGCCRVGRWTLSDPKGGAWSVEGDRRQGTAAEPPCGEREPLGTRPSGSGGGLVPFEPEACRPNPARNSPILGPTCPFDPGRAPDAPTHSTGISGHLSGLLQRQASAGFRPALRDMMPSPSSGPGSSERQAVSQVALVSAPRKYQVLVGKTRRQTPNAS